MKTVSYTLESLPPLTRAQREQLKSLVARPDNEIDTSDIPELTPQQLHSAQRIAVGCPVPASKNRGLGTILTEIGQELGGIELDIERNSKPSEPIFFGKDTES